MPPSIDPKFIPLAQAAKSYGYTRDHLGYLIRKGDLKGKKIGAYYYTTDEWIEKYVASQKSRREIPKTKKSLQKKTQKKLQSESTGVGMAKPVESTNVDELHGMIQGLHERVDEHENKLLNFTSEVSRHLGVGDESSQVFESTQPGEDIMIDDDPAELDLKQNPATQGDNPQHRSKSSSGIVIRVVFVLVLAVALGLLLSMSKTLTVVIDTSVDGVSSLIDALL